MDTKKTKVYEKQPQTTVKIRHNRFNGFDIYTAEITGRDKLLFHKPDTKNFIVAETFKFLGANDNLWLCESLEDGTIHIAPFDRFTQLDNKTNETPAS